MAVTMAEIVVSLNRRRPNPACEPQTTLAEALRGALELTGTRIACNRGCMLSVHGLARRKNLCAHCMLLLADVGERSVTTIEGLADRQTTYSRYSAHSSIRRHSVWLLPPGTRYELRRTAQGHAASDDRADPYGYWGHLCRCGTYPHVIEATLAAAGGVAE